MKAPLHPGLSEPAEKARISPVPIWLDLRAAVSGIIEGDYVPTDARPTGMPGGAQATGDRLAQVPGKMPLAATTALLPVPLHIGTLDFPFFVDDLRRYWGLRAQAGGLLFDIVTDPALPAALTLDRIALDRVLSEMLGHAVTHTGSGTVRLAIAVTDQGCLQFAVEDDSGGFSPDDLALTGGTAPDAQNATAAGPGLCTARNTSEHLRGALTLANRPGGGARVCLTLRPGAWLAHGSDDADVAALRDLSGLRVLVSEPDPVWQATLCTMLTVLGAKPVGVGAPHLVPHELCAAVYDIAIIGVDPGETDGSAFAADGLDTVRHLRADPRCPPVRVLAVVANGMAAQRGAILAAGADAVLAMPVSCIGAFSQAVAALAALPVADPAEAPVVRLFDQERLTQLLSIAGPVVAQELLARLTTDLHRVEHGLIRGLAGNDLAELRSQTHILTALAGAVGADRLQNLAEWLNAAAQGADPDLLVSLCHQTLYLTDHLVRCVSQEARRRRSHPRSPQ